MSYPYYTVTPILAGQNSNIEVFPVGRRAVIGGYIPSSCLGSHLADDFDYEAASQERFDQIQNHYDLKTRVRRRRDYPDGRQRYTRDCRCTLRVQKDRHQNWYHKSEARRNAAIRDARREEHLARDFLGTLDSLHLRYHAGDPDVEWLGTYAELEEYAYPPYESSEYSPEVDDFDFDDFDCGSPGDGFVYREFTDYHVRDTIDTMCDIYTALFQEHFNIVPHKLLTRWFKAFNVKRDFDFDKCLNCPHNNLYSTKIHRHLPGPCVSCCLNSPAAFSAIQESQFDAITLFGDYGPKELRTFLGQLFFDPDYASK